MRRFVAVDVETTGLDPEVHELIEVGLVAETVDGSVREFGFSVEFDETRADERALAVNGWGKRQFEPVVDPAWLSGFLREALDDAVLVGKNPHFDAAFLKAFMKKYGMGPSWHHRLVDVGALAWGYHNGLRWFAGEGDRYWLEPPNVTRTAELVDVPMPEGDLHTALGDARWAYNVLRKCVPLPVGQTPWVKESV